MVSNSQDKDIGNITVLRQLYCFHLHTHFLHFTSNTATVAVKSNSEAASRRLDHSVSS